MRISILVTIYWSLFFSGAIAQVNLNEGLLASFSFNGNADDSSGNQHHGAANNVVWVSDRFGNPDCAAFFDPAYSTYISVPHAPELDLDDSLCIVLWFKYAENNIPTYGHLISKGSNDILNNIWGIRKVDERTRAFFFYAPTSFMRYIGTTAHFNDTDWHCIIILQCHQRHISYIDGVKFNDEISDNYLHLNEDPLIIGHKYADGKLTGAYMGWHGCIDDIRLYSRFLTNDEIRLLSPEVTGVSSTFSEEGIQNIEMLQNYPNPFNAETQISYFLPMPGQVEFKVFDLSGRIVESVAYPRQERGWHTLHFDGSKLSSGCYFYLLKSGNFRETRKFIFLK